MTPTRLIANGALIAAIGAAISGPIGLGVVAMTAPQPLWSGIEVFIEHQAWIQRAPYYFGCALAIGSLMMFIGYYLRSVERHSATALGALIACVLYVAMVSFNYMSQIAVVPSLIAYREEQYHPFIAMLTMSNPDSICWTIEMWAYGLLGVATWLAAYQYDVRNKVVRTLMIANGLVSAVSWIGTMWGTRWVLEPIGLASFIAWNILFIWMAIAICTKERHSASQEPIAEDEAAISTLGAS